MIPYLTILKFIGPYLIAAIIGGVVVGKVQQVRINSFKADLSMAQHSLTACQDANATDQQTITHLTKEVSNALSGCETRLKARNKTIDNIRKIDGLSVPTQRKADEVNDEKTGKNNFADPLLDMLNGMFGRGAAGRKD